MNQHLEAGAVYGGAAIVAVCGLLAPLVGRFLADRGNRISGNRLLRQSLVATGWALVVWLLLAQQHIWMKSGQDWLLLTILATAFGLGLTKARLGLLLKTRWLKFGVQVVTASIPVILGVRIPITGSSPLLDGVCTVVFILGVINALAILNVFDGFSSLVVFFASAGLAVLLDLQLGQGGLGDPAGVGFAVAICGGSLGFFLLRRPVSRSYMDDPGTLLLGLALAVLAIRTWNVGGTAAINPVALFPLVLTLPILAASIHRERMSLFRRQRLAVILVMGGHLPFWIPVVLIPFADGIHGELSAQPANVGTGLMAVASMIIWAAFITQGRTLRGWSLRVMAEPIGNVLRIGLGLTMVQLLVGLALGIDTVYILLSGGMTTVLLIGQVTWWRRRVEARGLPDVVVFGTVEDYSRIRNILNNCEDLFARYQTRRARVGLQSKHLREAVAEHLRNGDTVVISRNKCRRALIGVRGFGDLVFAGDCILLRHALREAHPAHESVFEMVHDVMNRLLALVAIVVLLPVVVLIGVLIRLDDGGPVLFRQRRLGRYGRRFTLLKFRSMRTNAAKYDESPRDGRDPRLTRIGRFLRRLSLDELPQLINVLRGEMRLVGPRPEMPFICARYSSRERQRLDIPPGVTGLWQISPHRNDPIHDHVDYDLAYRSSRSAILDLAIIISTLLSGVSTGR